MPLCGTYKKYPRPTGCKIKRKKEQIKSVLSSCIGTKIIIIFILLFVYEFADASWGPGVNSVNLFMKSAANIASHSLKGLNREIFVAEIFTQSKPVWEKWELGDTIN